MDAIGGSKSLGSILAVLLVAALVGCSGESDGDADADGDALPDGDGPECSGDEECDDEVSCTLDECSGDGTCEHRPDDATCVAQIDDPLCAAARCAPDEPGADAATGCVIDLHDGTACEPEQISFCYSGWQCRGGGCVPDESTARDCSDGVECTVDSCDDEVDACVNRADHDACPDEPSVMICDPDDHDADERGCVAAEACVDSGTCADSSACNGVEQCVDGFCFPGEPMECRDGIGCTEDACDDLMGGCVFRVRHAFCDTGSRCTVGRCDPDAAGADDLGCTRETLTCDPDEDPCTLETCDDDLGCNPPAPAGSPCEDGFACVEGEICTAEGECDPSGGRPVTCDDGDPCSVDRCVEPRGCTADPAPDGTICGAEVLAGCREEVCVSGDCVERPMETCRLDHAEGCCPDACPVSLDLDCLGRGQIVMIGHDYDGLNDNISRIAGNAILMAVPGDVRVLGYMEFADFSTVEGEPAHFNWGVDRRARDLGRTWSREVFFRSADLVERLPDRDVLLLYEQEWMSDDDAEAVGRAWREPLREFVASGGTVVISDHVGATWLLAAAGGLFPLDHVSAIAPGSELRVADPASPLARGVDDYTATMETAAIAADGAITSVVETTGGVMIVGHARRPVPALSPWVDPVADGHTAVALSSGTADDGQYDIDLAPLSFRFDGEDQGCVAVGTNGYLRFGPAGACPEASGAAAADTDIDGAFAAGVAQVSWLGANCQATEDQAFVDIDDAADRVMITVPGVRRMGRSGTNDVQISLHTDTGDIQVSYRDCSFDTTDHWSFGVSEPGAAGAVLSEHDFAAQWPGTTRWFEAGAVAQAPEHTGTAAYAMLAGHAIYYERVDDAWRVLVSPLP
jgi:hypothetical protein